MEPGAVVAGVVVDTVGDGQSTAAGAWLAHCEMDCAVGVLGIAGINAGNLSVPISVPKT